MLLMSLADDSSLSCQDCIVKMPNSTRKRSNSERSEEGHILTELILAIFKTNVDLMAIGPMITHDPEIVAVRWLMLNAISTEGKTAAQLGRELGLSRQGALWNVQALEALRLVELVDNPEDRRAKIVALSAEGVEKLEIVNKHQAEWINRLAQNFEAHELEIALRVVSRLHEYTPTSVDAAK
ncbi:MarR family winged helix-turn-helix transcriptional regulator [Burkholderia cepacia]|uniref:MarR family winged helix-turn-helix transcriptional regulator n=1 Tax=Burkholderia cepacia TaxID=292 RepID=UPI002AB7078C|nr:MarR family winged helix-turn-helix transcriptional regulator [Burkholderia cepacia]